MNVNTAQDARTQPDTAESELLSLFRDVLRQQMDSTFDERWKGEILKLAEREDREYTVLSAFRNCLTSAFEQLRRFPEQYRKYRGLQPPAGAAPVVLRYREESALPAEPLMTDQQHDTILSERCSRDPAFARMLHDLKKGSRAS